jgi:hypothetical protein
MNHELLKLGIEIVRAIPDSQFDLWVFQAYRLGDGKFATELEQATCGTICCAAGWMALNPVMHRAGLYTSWNTGNPMFDMGEEDVLSGVDALAAFFDISFNEAQALFGPRMSFETAYFGSSSVMSDKQLWLRRAESFTGNRQRFSRFFICQISGSEP